MIVQPLDRNDVIAPRFDVYEPEYRVDFWRRPDSLAEVAAEKIGYKQDSYGLKEVRDVDEVVAWADENAQGRLYVVWVKYSCQGDRGIIRIRGEDPTNPAGNASLGGH